ncbi:MAG: hypothetical protein AB1626_05980, partial [Candidatus Micrarchaeota archaeon]
LACLKASVTETAKAIGRPSASVAKLVERLEDKHIASKTAPGRYVVADGVLEKWLRKKYCKKNK